MPRKSESACVEALVGGLRRAWLLVCIVPALAMAQAPAAPGLNPAHAEALQGLACGRCVELGEVVTARVGGRLDIDLNQFVATHLIAITPASEAALQTERLIGAPETALPRSTHVCVGSRQKVERMLVLPLGEADRQKPVVRLQVHPAVIDGVCIGSLQPMEVFLEAVMSDVFARRLKEFDARVTPEKLEVMVRNRLADALAKDRALMTEEIKRAVVADLRAQGGSGTTPPAGAPDAPKVCTSGAFSCNGKPPDQCCRCLDFPGVEGTCDTGATPKSWMPKVQKP